MKRISVHGTEFQSPTKCRFSICLFFINLLKIIWIWYTGNKGSYQTLSELRWTSYSRLNTFIHTSFLKMHTLYTCSIPHNQTLNFIPGTILTHCVCIQQMHLPYMFHVFIYIFIPLIHVLHTCFTPRNPTPISILGIQSFTLHPITHRTRAHYITPSSINGTRWSATTHHSSSLWAKKNSLSWALWNSSL